MFGPGSMAIANFIVKANYLSCLGTRNVLCPYSQASRVGMWSLTRPLMADVCAKAADVQETITMLCVNNGGTKRAIRFLAHEFTHLCLLIPPYASSTGYTTRWLLGVKPLLLSIDAEDPKLRV